MSISDRGMHNYEIYVDLHTSESLSDDVLNVHEHSVTPKEEDKSEKNRSKIQKFNESFNSKLVLHTFYDTNKDCLPSMPESNLHDKECCEKDCNNSSRISTMSTPSNFCSSCNSSSRKNSVNMDNLQLKKLNIESNFRSNKSLSIDFGFSGSDNYTDNFVDSFLTDTPPTFRDVNKTKGCNCQKTSCLKLYCECFARGDFCYNCNCKSCFNNPENFEKWQRATETVKNRRKITAELNGTLKRGCNCKKSLCMKKYCECFEKNLYCTDICKCSDCRNLPNSEKRFSNYSKNRYSLGAVFGSEYDRMISNSDSYLFQSNKFVPNDLNFTRNKSFITPRKNDNSAYGSFFRKDKESAHNKTFPYPMEYNKNDAGYDLYKIDENKVYTDSLYDTYEASELSTLEPHNQMENRKSIGYEGVLNYSNYFSESLNKFKKNEKSCNSDQFLNSYSKF